MRTRTSSRTSGSVIVRGGMCRGGIIGGRRGGMSGGESGWSIGYSRVRVGNWNLQCTESWQAQNSRVGRNKEDEMATGPTAEKFVTVNIG